MGLVRPLVHITAQFAMFICLRKFASPTVRSQQKFVKPLFVVQRLRVLRTMSFLRSRACSHAFLSLTQTVGPWWAAPKQHFRPTQRILIPLTFRNIYTHSWKSEIKEASRKSLQVAQTTPTSILVHDYTPVDIGIIVQSGFFTMIPTRTKLPYKKVVYLSNILDYDTRTSISICSRRSLFHTPSLIQVAELHGTRAVKREDTEFKVTLEMGKGLSGHFTVRDMFTRQECTVDLNVSGNYSQDIEILQLDDPLS